MLRNITKLQRAFLANKSLKCQSLPYTNTSTQDILEAKDSAVKVNDAPSSLPTTTNTTTTTSSLNVTTKTPMSFAQMFKESTFVSLGNLENKFLIGKIVDIVADDMYIDYGGKFNCVCKIPTTDIK
jgi:hypothetical protein